MNSILETETQTEAQIKANDINRRSHCAERKRNYEKKNTPVNNSNNSDCRYVYAIAFNTLSVCRRDIGR